MARSLIQQLFFLKNNHKLRHVKHSTKKKHFAKRERRVKRRSMHVDSGSVTNQSDHKYKFLLLRCGVTDSLLPLFVLWRK